MITIDQRRAITRGVGIAMVVLAVLYVVVVAYQARHASRIYADIGLGMTRAEARYFLGRPTAVAGTASLGERWTFTRAADTMAVRFAPDTDRVSAVACVSSQASTLACQPTLGLGTGTTEDVVWSRLGPPDSQRFSGPDKVITYRALGLTFTLREFAVTQVALSDEDGAGGFWRRLPYLLLP